MQKGTNSVFRVEKKYEVPIYMACKVEQALKWIMPVDGNSSDKGYSVRSLYFDSIYDVDLFDKINGLNSRKKIRLRIYDVNQKWVKLEMKQKQGASQLKRSIRISKEIAMELIEGKYDALLQMEDSLAEEFYTVMSVGVYKPKCIIEYERIAFVGVANDTRITIDSGIKVSSNVKKFFDADIVFSPIFKHPVVEVKYNHFLLEHYKQVIRMIDLPEMSCSKYELARMKSY